MSILVFPRGIETAQLYSWSKPSNSEFWTQSLILQFFFFDKRLILQFNMYCIVFPTWGPYSCSYLSCLFWYYPRNLQRIKIPELLADECLKIGYKTCFFM